MIITCPSCSVKFNVPDGAITPEGRKLKCSKCQFLWHFKPKAEVLAMAVAAQAHKSPPAKPTERPLRARPEAGAPLPARLRINAPWWMTAFAAVILLAVAGVIGLTWLPGLLGIASSAGLSLADVAVKPVTAADGASVLGYSITGNIVNTTQEERKLPDIRLVLMDKQGKKAGSWPVKPEANLLAPGARVHFSGSVDEKPSEGLRMRIDVGNPLELLLRPIK